jgi:hypothetical protein
VLKPARARPAVKARSLRFAIMVCLLRQVVVVRKAIQKRNQWNEAKGVDAVGGRWSPYFLLRRRLSV